jgi:hypothetical protein
MNQVRLTGPSRATIFEQSFSQLRGVCLQGLAFRGILQLVETGGSADRNRASFGIMGSQQSLPHKCGRQLSGVQSGPLTR